MRKAEGIVVVASVPGKPVSEVEAQLELYGFTEFTTVVADGWQVYSTVTSIQETRY